MVAYFSNPNVGKESQEDSWTSLPMQSGRIDELQAQWKILSQKKNQLENEWRQSILTSNFQVHTYAYVPIYTHEHAHKNMYIQHTHKHKFIFVTD